MSKQQLKLSREQKQIMTFIMIIVIFVTAFIFIKMFPPPTSESNDSNFQISNEHSAKLSLTIKLYTEVKEDDNWWLPNDAIIKEQVLEFDFTEDDRIARYIQNGYTITKVEVKELKFYAKASGNYKEAYVKVSICGKTKTVYSPSGSFYEMKIYETVYESSVTATVTVYVYANIFATPSILAKDFSLTATVYLTKTGGSKC